MAEPFYITTAISYPNGPPHIGHAYEAIAADVIARFQRSQGRDVRFQTGTDEHGLKMAQAARSEGVEPREFADKMSRLFQEMCDTLNVSYDRFIRTSQPDHYRASQAIWTAMAERGVKGTTAASLARHVQTVIQGAFILAKTQGEEGAADLAREALGHLRRYFELLFAMEKNDAG